VIGDHAVDLFGHRPVVGTHPRLDVNEREQQLLRDDGAGERAVRIAAHDDDVRRRGGDRIAEAPNHFGDLGTRAEGADPEVDVRLGNRKVGEKFFRHAIVVMLSRVHECFVMARTENSGQDGDLDEFGSSAHD